MRAGAGADAIEGVGDVGHPVAQRLVHRVLQRARARLHRPHLGAEQLHAEDVGLLPLDVDRAHVDDAFQAEAGAGGGGGDAVLAGAGLGDDARLAHAPGEQDLAEHVVDLVRAGVVELLALEIDLRAAEMRGQPLGEIERARPADVVGQQPVELAVEFGVGLGLAVGLLQRQHQRHQRLGDEAAAENAEMAALVGAVAERIGLVDFGHAGLLASCSRAKAARAAATKAAIFFSSLTPGARSTPDETSTPRAPDSAIASPTLSGVEPARQQPRDFWREIARQAPVERPAVAARQHGVLRRLGVDQQPVGDALVVARAGEVRRLGDADRLHRRQAEGLLDRRHALRRLAAMQLQQVRADDARRSPPAGRLPRRPSARRSWRGRAPGAASSWAWSRPTKRGLLAKNTSPTMSAPASSAASSVAAVARPQILTVETMRLFPTRRRPSQRFRPGAAVADNCRRGRRSAADPAPRPASPAKGGERGESRRAPLPVYGEGRVRAGTAAVGRNAQGQTWPAAAFTNGAMPQRSPALFHTSIAAARSSIDAPTDLNRVISSRRRRGPARRGPARRGRRRRRRGRSRRSAGRARRRRPRSSAAAVSTKMRARFSAASSASRICIEKAPTRSRCWPAAEPGAGDQRRLRQRRAGDRCRPRARRPRVA